MGNDINCHLLTLQNENVKLREKITYLLSLEQDNEELRKLLLLKKTIGFSVLSAQVVNVFSNDFTQSFTLNVGKDHAVSEGDLVKNSDGLIGRIVEVHSSWSRALSITDMNSSIPVKMGKYRINGIVTGNGSNKLLLSTIQGETPVSASDIVVTSEYGITEGVPIGKISTDLKTIEPFVNFNTLHYVIVIRQCLHSSKDEQYLPVGS
jgi:rod shape-determining protein MreC